MRIDFDWDSVRAASNVAKRDGVTFEEVVTVFRDALVRLTLSTLCTVEHGDDRDFAYRFIDLVDNHIWQSNDDPLVCPDIASHVSHVRQRSQAIGGIANARNNLGCRP